MKLNRKNLLMFDFKYLASVSFTGLVKELGNIMMMQVLMMQCKTFPELELVHLYPGHTTGSVVCAVRGQLKSLKIVEMEILNISSLPYILTGEAR